MGGRGVKASRRWSVENPRDLKAQEGIEAAADVTTLSVTNGSVLGSRLWRPGLASRRRRGNPAAGERVRRSREHGLAMSQVGWVPGKPPVEQISDVAVG
jgi:hypothetical protein